MTKLTVDECFSEIKNGANIKQGIVDDGYPITRIETLSDDRFNRDRMGYAGITDIDKYKDYVLCDGDLLMSHINSPKYLGRTVMYRAKECETIIHGMNLLRLKARRNIIEPAYAELLFYSQYVREQIGKIMKKSVNQASFSVTDLKKIKVDIPSIDEQQYIVEKIDKLKSILSMRQNELEQLDLLIKARFVEMFEGLSDSKYPVKKLSEIVHIKHGYAFAGEFFSEVDNGVLLLTPGNFQIGGGFQEKRCKFFTGDYPEEFVLKPGELIVTMTDLSKKMDTLGYAAILPEQRNRVYLHNQRIGLFDEIDESINRCYLMHYMQTDDYRTCILSSATGSTVHHTSPGKILETKIMIPPISLQKEFEQFVAQVDKSKVAVQRSLDESQLLFDSLMQKYFG